MGTSLKYKTREALEYEWSTMDEHAQLTRLNDTYNALGDMLADAVQQWLKQLERRGMLYYAGETVLDGFDWALERMEATFGRYTNPVWFGDWYGEYHQKIGHYGNPIDPRLQDWVRKWVEPWGFLTDADRERFHAPV